jgi:acylaminoacyl-peptidase
VSNSLLYSFQAHVSSLPGVRVRSTITDFKRKEKRTTTRVLFLQSDDTALSTPPQDVSSDVKLSAISPSGRLTAILRQVTKGEKIQRYVEVWAEDVMQASVDTTDIHDAFYTDGTPRISSFSLCSIDPEYFGLLSFSPSENMLAYVAEAKSPSFDNDDSYERFRYAPNLGEQLTDRYRPRIFVLRWSLDAPPSVIALDPPSVVPQTIGQPVFLSDTSLAIQALDLTIDGRVLGVRFCVNRPTAIWVLELTSTEDTTITSARQCSDSTKAARLPRVHDGTLFWLEHERGGPHASCSCLISMEAGDNTRTVVPYVSDPKPECFRGLFIGWALPTRPFVKLGESSYMVCSIVRGTRNVIVAIDVKQEKVYDLTPEDGTLWSWNVLCTDGKARVVCSRSSLTTPPQLVLGTITKAEVLDSAPTASWKLVWEPKISPRGMFLDI